MTVIVNECDKAFIYPNPASIGYFYLNVPLTNTAEDRFISIYDSKGALVYQGKSNSNISRMYSQHLNSGVYIVVVRNAQGSIIKKGKVDILVK